MVATLQDLDKMKVDFTVPEQALGSLRIGQPAHFGLTPDRMTYSGEVTGIDPKIDPQTRLVSVQALIDNPNDELRPGQFIRIRVELPEEKDVIAVSQTAITTSLYGDYAFVVEEAKPDPAAPPPRRLPPSAGRGRPRARRPPGLRQDRASERRHHRNPERAQERRADRDRRPESPVQRRSGEDRQHRRSDQAGRTPPRRRLSAMGFSELFIRRPVLSTVVGLMILLLGGQGILNMSIRQYPKVDETVITITTTYAGASADLMQGFITTPIAAAVASSEGTDYITSTSTLGTEHRPGAHAA